MTDPTAPEPGDALARRLAGIEEQTARLNRIENTLAEHTERFAAIDERLAGLGAGVETIVGMLETLLRREGEEPGA